MSDDLFIIALSISGYGLVIAVLAILIITAYLNRRVDKKIANANNRRPGRTR